MTTTTVVHEEERVPLLIRILWFILIGWHVTLYWIVAAWLLNLTVIGLPLGLWMLNRVPLVLTLRMPRTYTYAQLNDGRVVSAHTQGLRQHPWPLRLLYFLLVGWWLSLLCALLGWLLCVSIIGLPFGILLLDRLPNITTLMRQ